MERRRCCVCHPTTVSSRFTLVLFVFALIKKPAISSNASIADILNASLLGFDAALNATDMFDNVNQNITDFDDFELKTNISLLSNEVTVVYSDLTVSPLEIHGNTTIIALDNSTKIQMPESQINCLTNVDSIYSERQNDSMPVMTVNILASDVIDSDLLSVESMVSNKVSAVVQISSHLENTTIKQENDQVMTKITLPIMTTTKAPTIITTTAITKAENENTREGGNPTKSLTIATTKATTTATTINVSVTPDFQISRTTTMTTIPMTTDTSVLFASSTVNSSLPSINKEHIELPFEITSMQELREYRRELNQILRRIEKELFLREGYKIKHFTPIATSLPKKISSIFLQKISAALNVSPKGNDRDELDKRLLSLVSPSPNSRLEPDYPNMESFMLAAAASAASATNNRRFNPVKNHTVEECKRLSQAELVKELKQRGTYNPDLMAWDVSGVLSFLDRSIADQYERQIKSQKSNQQAVQRNVEALERLLSELNIRCNVSTPEVIAKLSNLTLTEPRRSIMSPSIRLAEDEIRYKRSVAEDLIHSFNRSYRYDNLADSKKQKMLGEVHVVPFGCDKRGELEDGYLRLCGACQTIRKLPDSFFPPFINEVTCDEDKACLYFYDYPHGKCKQKHMNFVVLKNIGTQDCQIWQKFNLNVRVSCECFADEMSFFAKYV